ncbi:MAG: energy-coupling factor transporter transmembrane component T [Nocardioides sp.]
MEVARLPRDLHPVAWWLWAIGLATAASLTTNPLLLLLLIGVATLVVMARRSDQPWAASYRLYVWVGVAIVLIRIVFRILFSTGGPTVLLDLPAVPLPGWAAGVTLLGPLTLESLLAGFYDGLRLATIVIAVGAANALANPKRLLRSVPPALYEIGTALVVAVSVLPQFADSVRRVRAAQSLRGGAEGRIGRLRRVLVPVLEDALERSLALAAGMDTRGYGRSGSLTPAHRRRTGALMLVGLCGVCVGTYAFLDQSAPRILALPMLALGLLAALGGLLHAGRTVERTRYRPDRWRWPELVVACSGIVVAAGGWWISGRQSLIAHPGVDAFPQVSLVALLAAGAALSGALCSPPPSVARPVREEVAA